MDPSSDILVLSFCFKKCNYLYRYTLVTATLLRRLDVLRDIIDGRGAMHDAWVAAVVACAEGAAARGDHGQARFLASLRQEMEGGAAAPQ